MSEPLHQLVRVPTGSPRPIFRCSCGNAWEGVEDAAAAGCSCGAAWCIEKPPVPKTLPLP